MSNHASNETSTDRWDGIKRDYARENVERLRGSVQVRHTLAELGAICLRH